MTAPARRRRARPVRWGQRPLGEHGVHVQAVAARADQHGHGVQPGGAVDRPVPVTDPDPTGPVRPARCCRGRRWTSVSLVVASSKRAARRRCPRGEQVRGLLRTWSQRDTISPNSSENGSSSRSSGAGVRRSATVSRASRVAPRSLAPRPARRRTRRTRSRARPSRPRSTTAAAAGHSLGSPASSRASSR